VFFLIIGSMLVAPFIDPIVSLVVLTKSRKIKKILKAVWSLFLAIGVVFLVCGLFWLISLPSFDFNQITFSFEYLPVDNLMIAIIIGMISSLLWIWPKASDTSTGIAVAISLVPPIAYAMLYLVARDMVNFTNQMNTFLINFLGIILGAKLIMFIYARGDHKDRL
jgi:uncharacterized membrane protein